MKHNIRQRVINEYGLPVVKVETIQGELGSGIFDKYGQEIFEGDEVQMESQSGGPIGWNYVEYRDGAFYLNDELLAENLQTLEVVGHVES